MINFLKCEKGIIVALLMAVTLPCIMLFNSIESHAFMGPSPKVLLCLIGVPQSVSMNTGESTTITANVTDDPRGEFTYKKWSSSNTDVATVDSKGTVKAESAGSAKISVQAVSYDGEIISSVRTCNVTVACRITFDMDGGKTKTGSYTKMWRNLLLNANSYSIGAEYMPTKSGYAFGGFYTGKNGTGTQYFDAATGKLTRVWDKTTSTTLYAKWYRTQFEMEGGKTKTGNYVRIWRGVAVNTTSHSIESQYLPTKSGYKFGGFYTGKNGTGTQYYNSSGKLTRKWDKSSNTTLYAKWTK